MMVRGMWTDRKKSEWYLQLVPSCLRSVARAMVAASAAFSASASSTPTTAAGAEAGAIHHHGEEMPMPMAIAHLSWSATLSLADEGIRVDQRMVLPSSSVLPRPMLNVAGR